MKQALEIADIETQRPALQGTKGILEQAGIEHEELARRPIGQWRILADWPRDALNR